MSTKPDDFSFPGSSVYQRACLTKREYFAAKALQGLADRWGVDESRFKEAAKRAVALADALIDALNEEKE